MLVNKLPPSTLTVGIYERDTQLENALALVWPCYMMRRTMNPGELRLGTRSWAERWKSIINSGMRFFYFLLQRPLHFGNAPNIRQSLVRALCVSHFINKRQQVERHCIPTRHKVSHQCDGVCSHVDSLKKLRSTLSAQVSLCIQSAAEQGCKGHHS